MRQVLVSFGIGTAILVLCFLAGYTFVYFPTLTLVIALIMLAYYIGEMVTRTVRKNRGKK